MHGQPQLLHHPTIPDQEWSQFSSGALVSAAVPSRRVSLRMERVAGPLPTRCYFDNLVLLGPSPNPLEIPTASRLGLGVLSVLLAGAALALLASARLGRGAAAGRRR